MPANSTLICRVLLPNGEQCGYAPEGETSKAKLIALFTHEATHKADVEQRSREVAK